MESYAKLMFYTSHAYPPTKQKEKENFSSLYEITNIAQFFFFFWWGLGVDNYFNLFSSCIDGEVSHLYPNVRGVQ